MSFLVRPCPFCGGQGFISWQSVCGGEDRGCFVRCENCGSRTGDVYLWETNDQAGLAVLKAYEMWNRRA
jgi:uncharacterized Zn finger protein